MKILWASRLGFPCSFNDVSISLYQSFKHCNPGYEFYFQTVSVSPTDDMVRKFCSEINLPLDRFFYTRVNYDMSTPEDCHFETLALYGYTSIISTVRQVQPQLVIILDDTALIHKISDRFKKAFGQRELPRNFKLVAYLPIDCNNCTSFVEKCIYDAYITPTWHGRLQLRPYLPYSTPIYVLPHIVNNFGVNQIKFQSTFDELRILSVNTRHVRKRWDLILETYLKFVQLYKKPSRLIIKTFKQNEKVATLSPNSQQSIEQLYFSLAEKYENNGMAQVEVIDDVLPAKSLALLQLSSHIGLYMSSGEGFGLTPLEGAALGIPQIVPDNTSFRELFQFYPYRVKTKKVSLYEGRENIADLSNSYLCLFKSYQYDQVQMVKESSLTISNIPTYLLAPEMNEIKLNQLTIKPIKNFSSLIELSSELSWPMRYQIIIKIEPSFLKELNWDLYPKCLSTGDRYELYLDDKVIKKIYSFDTGYVEIPMIDDAVNKLLTLANDASERKRAAIMCQHYTKKYTKDSVSKSFINILSKLIPILKPVVIFSHERSGCHMLINSLVLNFGYDQQWMDIDNLKLFDQKFESGKIYKCHHCYQHIQHIDFSSCHLILLQRDKNKTLSSYRKFLYMLPNASQILPKDKCCGDEKIGEGPHVEEDYKFWETETIGQQERYQSEKNITHSQRYDQFYQSYDNSSLILIKINHDELVTNFTKVMLDLNLQSYNQPSHADLTIL